MIRLKCTRVTRLWPFYLVLSTDESGALYASADMDAKCTKAFCGHSVAGTVFELQGDTVCGGGAVDATYLMHFHHDCKTISGDVLFTDESFDIANNMPTKCMDSVETLEGRLVYEGITKYTSSPCLNNLHKIDHKTGGPAIELRHNKGLTSLQLEKLVEIRNKDKVVFRVMQDKYLEQTSEYELESMIKAAGGNESSCRDLFFVWQKSGDAPDKEESYFMFFLFYGIVSVIVYLTILSAHFLFKVHIPPSMRRGQVSMRSLRSLRSLKSLKSLKSVKSQRQSSQSLPNIARTPEPEP